MRLDPYTIRVLAMRLETRAAANEAIASFCIETARLWRGEAARKERAQRGADTRAARKGSSRS